MMPLLFEGNSSVFRRVLAAGQTMMAEPFESNNLLTQHYASTIWEQFT
jgi:hypothetical protein